MSTGWILLVVWTTATGDVTVTADQTLTLRVCEAVRRAVVRGTTDLPAVVAPPRDVVRPLATACLPAEET